MTYKTFILIATMVLLAGALTTTVVVLNAKRTAEKQSALLADKIHTALYRDATSIWDGQLISGPFNPTDIAGETHGSSTYIRLTWQPPTQTYHHFLITITDPRTRWTRIESGEHDRTSLDLSDLKSDTKYTMTVQACLDQPCRTWLMPSEETTYRTDKPFWQIVDTAAELKKATEVEDWQNSIILNDVSLIKSDNSLYSADEKNTFIIERVVHVPKSDEIIMTLVQRVTSRRLFAKLLNP
ncbi:fibronectin type III domain-containing protein [Candidatus Uhrbacteria bacterium]|nr:fibronectin type III domain-containing protein [Candidatus Uhrbacteria bacterium]